MAAMARTWDQVIMKDGYDKETTRRTLSGAGTEHIRQATRGLTSVPLWRIYDERIDRDLATMDGGKDAVKYARHGARMTRFSRGYRRTAVMAIEVTPTPAQRIQQALLAQIEGRRGPIPTNPDFASATRV